MIELILPTFTLFDTLIQSLSVNAKISSSIWCSIYNQVHSCNKTEKRHKLFLKWKNNSCNIQFIVKDGFNKSIPSVSAEDQFQVCYNLNKLDMQLRGLLIAFVAIKDVSNRAILGAV